MSVSTRNTVADLNFVIEEHKELPAGRSTFHHFKVDFGNGKKLELVMSGGSKMEAMVQMIHTLGHRMKEMTPAEFEAFKNDRSIEQIYFGAHDNDDGSFETTLYRISLHGDKLQPLFAMEKKLLKIDKEQEKAIRLVADGLEAKIQQTPPPGAAAQQGANGMQLTVRRTT